MFVENAQVWLGAWEPAAFSQRESIPGLSVERTVRVEALAFQDIAPQARLERHWAPPLGAVLGFALALLAHMAL